MKRIVILGLLMLLAFSAPAMAGIGRGNGEIGFDFGYAKFDKNVTDKNGGAFSFRGGYHFTKLFELEGQLGGLATHDDQLDEDISLSTIFVNGVFNFHSQSGNIVPYVLAGAGQARLEFKIGGFSTDDNGAAYHAAGGCRFFFGQNKKVAFRIEADFIRAKPFDTTSNHRRYVFGGFTWRIGRK